jgi:branched-chain amino acid aminotransferase
MKVYWKGKLIEARKAKIPLQWDYINGSALAGAMGVKNGKIVNAASHWGRFKEGAQALMFRILSRKEFENASSQVIKANRMRRGNLRCRYFRDGAFLVHPLPAWPKPSKVRLFTATQRHYGPASMQARLKANSMLPNWLAKAETRTLAEEGLRLGPEGYVIEGVWTNILIERKGLLYSPPLAQGALEGTERSGLIKRWRGSGRRIIERPLTRYDLYSADKVWICSSSRGAQRVDEVDGRKIGALI